MITPKISEMTDKSSVVLKTVHDETHKRIESLESRVQSERELRLKTQNENEELENRIKELLDSKTKKEIEKNPKIVVNTKTKLLSDKLIKEKKVELFENVASDILNGYSILKDQEHITEFTNLGLIKPGNYKGDRRYTYSLTQSGNDIHENLILEKLK
jgi:hypothetical protein